GVAVGAPVFGPGDRPGPGAGPGEGLFAADPCPAGPLAERRVVAVPPLDLAGDVVEAPPAGAEPGTPIGGDDVVGASPGTAPGPVVDGPLASTVGAFSAARFEPEEHAPVRIASARR